MSIKIGRQLVSFLNDAEMKEEEVANSFGVTVTAVKHWENDGGIKNENIKKFSDIYSVDIINYPISCETISVLDRVIRLEMKERYVDVGGPFSLSEFIDTYVIYAKVTQEELAKQLTMSAPALSLVKNGKYPHEDRGLERIVERFSFAIDDIKNNSIYYNFSDERGLNCSELIEFLAESNRLEDYKEEREVDEIKQVVSLYGDIKIRLERIETSVQDSDSKNIDKEFLIESIKDFYEGLVHECNSLKGLYTKIEENNNNIKTNQRLINSFESVLEEIRDILGEVDYKDVNKKFIIMSEGNSTNNKTMKEVRDELERVSQKFSEINETISTYLTYISDRKKDNIRKKELLENRDVNVGAVLILALGFSFVTSIIRTNSLDGATIGLYFILLLYLIAEYFSLKFRKNTFFKLFSH